MSGSDSVPTADASWVLACSTFDMSGGRRHAKRAVGRPLDGRVMRHRLAVNSYAVTSACRSRPARVPTLSSACNGTMQPFAPRFMTARLARFLEAELCSALTASAPDMRGSLGMRWLNREDGYQRVALCGERKLFDV